MLTAILANPEKSRRERMVDFGLVGLVQIVALGYGLHAVWVARPAVLAFEHDRLVVVTANEIDVQKLSDAPEGLRHLALGGVMKVGTRQAVSSDEFFKSVEQGLNGVSPAMRPGWWLPWEQQINVMRERAKPLQELMARRPEAHEVLRAAVDKAGQAPSALFYLPLTSSNTREWIVLLDEHMNIVGHAHVDGF